MFIVMVWINYLKSKVVEVRNVKTGMSADKMARVIKDILLCLYGDKKEEVSENRLYSNLEELYNKSFSKKDDILKQLKEEGIVVLKVDGDDLKMISLSKDIINKIEK